MSGYLQELLFSSDAGVGHFFDQNYILDAGNTNDVAQFATTLRLNITADERVEVLDYLHYGGGMISRQARIPVCQRTL